MSIDIDNSCGKIASFAKESFMSNDLIRADQINSLTPGSVIRILGTIYIKAQLQPNLGNSAIIHPDTGWVGPWMFLVFMSDTVEVITRK